MAALAVSICSDVPVIGIINSVLIVCRRKKWEFAFDMLSKIVDEIRTATKSIEELNSRMRTLEPGQTDQVSRQISQQVSFFPMFLSQQIKMIADLERQFGEEFQSKCLDEVKEIAETAKNVQATTESALTCVQSSESSKQIECADALFKGTSRLNILQQRITAKMMRCKRQSV